MPGFLRKTVIFLAFVFCVIFAAPAAYAACCDAGSYGSGKGCTACPAPFNNSNNAGKVCPNTTINSCYLTLSSGYYYNGKSGAVEVCPTGYTCPGGATVYYGETGQIGRTANCNQINRDKNPPAGIGSSVVPILYKKTGSTAWYSDNTCTTQQTTPTNIPTYSGYVCTGFYTEESGGTRVIDQNGNLLSWYASQPTYIYAQWINPIVTVSLNNQSATTAGSTAVYERYNTGIYLDAAATSQQMTTSINHITLPTRTGYTFGGYYTGTNGTGTQLINASGYITNSFTTTRFTAGTTIYAKWTPNTYTVTFKSGDITIGTQTFTYGTAQNLTDLADLSNVSALPEYLLRTTSGDTNLWKFKGWTTNNNSTGTAYANGTSVNNLSSTNGGVVTLYGVWQRTLSYRRFSSATATNWTTGAGTQYYKGNTSVSNLSLPALVAHTTYGWNPVGWVTNASSTTPDIAQTTAVTLTPAANTTIPTYYYALYNRTITLSYDANGGSGTVNNQTAVQHLSYGANGQHTISFTLANASGLTAPTGYSFSKWAPGSVNGTPQYDAGASFYFPNKTLSSDSTYTMYAIWTPNTITLDWNENGGNAINNGSCDYGDDLILPAAPTRLEYTFAGWKLADNTIKSAGATVTGGCTSTYTGVTSGTSTAIQAQWTPETYTISYELNGGTNYNGAPTSYAYGVGAVINGTPTHDYGTFAGWCTDSALQNCSSAQNISTSATGAKTFYAKWTCNTGFEGDSCHARCNAITVHIKARGGYLPGYTNVQDVVLYRHSGHIDVDGGNVYWWADANCSSTRVKNFTEVTPYRTLPKKDNAGFSGVYSNNTDGYAVDYLADYVAKDGSFLDIDINSDVEAWAHFVCEPDYAENGKDIKRLCDKNYTITLNSNGATTSGTGALYTIHNIAVYLDSLRTEGHEMTTLAYPITNPTKTGHTFGGYYSGSGGTGTQYISNTGYITTNGVSAGINATANTTWYGKWTPNRFKITFRTMPLDPNNVETYAQYGTADLYTTVGGSTLATVPLFNIPHGSFGGWNANLAPNGQTPNLVPIYTVNNGVAQLVNTTVAGYVQGGVWVTTEDRNLYPIINCDTGYSLDGNTGECVGNEYVVTLDKNAADATAGNIVQVNVIYGDSMPGLSAINALPTRNGYQFVGYYDEPTGGTKYYNADGTSAHIWDKTGEEEVLYAHWTGNTISLTYDGNGQGGTAPTQPATCTYGDNFTLPAAMSATGYTFAGWKSTGEPFAAGSSVTCNYTNLGVYSGSAIFYANWNDNVYTITLNKASGTGGTSTIYEQYGNGWYSNSGATTSISSVTAPTRSGYIFGGYYTGQNGAGTKVINSDGTIVSSNTAFSANTTVYAYWVQEKFSVDVDTSYTEDSTFVFRMTATGTFYVDWGDTVETIVKNDTSEGTYSHTWNGSSHVGTVRFGGVATGYSDNSSAYSAIKFYWTDGDSAHNEAITGVHGSLGALFPKIGNGTTLAQMPNFRTTFAYTTNLTSVPATLFSGYNAGRDNMFYGTFVGSGLTSIPSGLFDSITVGASNEFLQTFSDCTALSSIPSGLFANINSTADGLFNATFQGCTSLTSIPENLFFSSNQTLRAWMFQGTFAMCSGINAQTIPANIFQYVTGAAEGAFMATFAGSSFTGQIPATLFQNVSGTANQMFLGTFYLAPNLSSYVPKTLFANVTDTPTEFMSMIFADSGVATTCPIGMMQWFTGFESYWDGRVSCDTGIYEITLNKNNGNGGTGTIYEKYGVNYYGAITTDANTNRLVSGNAINSVTVPTRTGYVFTGYWTAASGGTKLINADGTFNTTNLTNTRFTADSTIYAQWTPNTYTIAYTPNGGTLGTNQPTSGTYDTEFTVDNPTHPHGTFAGWNVTGMDSTTHYYGVSSATTSSTATSWAYTTITPTIKKFKNLRATSGAVTFAAKWNCATGYTGDDCHADSYTITAKACNGMSTVAATGWTNTGTATMTKTFNYGDTITLSTLAGTNKTGYTGTGYNIYSGEGSISNGVFTVGAGAATICLSATALSAPTASLTPASTTKVFNYQATTLTASNSTSYASGVTLYYKFGNSATSDGTYTYGSAQTGTTTTVVKDAYRGTKYYKVQIYASDGTLTSTTTTSSAASVTLDNKAITFNTNNCGTLSGTSPIYVSYDNAATYSTATGTTARAVPTASKTGYIFDGWYTATSGGNQIYNASSALTAAAITGYTSGSKWVATEDKVLYAHCSAQTSTVTLNPNGGSGGTASVTAMYDSAMPAATMPTRAGYTFVGYYDTDAATGGTQYYTSAGASARNWDKTGDQTLWARWTANTNTAYKVYHYTKNLGATTYTQNGNVDNLTGTSDATLTLVNLKRTITGFKYSEGFAGTAATGINKPESGAVTETTVLADGTRVISLYYNRDTHTVTLAKGTCSAVSGGGTYEYGANVSISATPGTGYDWVKWTQTSGGAQVSTANPYAFTMGTSNLSYTANCTPSTYTITYTMNGGNNYTNAPTSYTYGTGVTINGTPTRANSTFTGWTGSNGNTPQTTVTISTTATGNKSYTANWTCNAGYSASGNTCVANNYTITLDNANATTNGTATLYTTHDTDVYLNSARTLVMSESANPITLPLRRGYRFVGYKCPAEGGEQPWELICIDEDGHLTSSGRTHGIGYSDSTKTWNVAWGANVYTVTLNKNNGTGGSNAAYEYFDNAWYNNDPSGQGAYTITSVPSLPTRANYTFRGYYTEQVADVTSSGNTGTQEITKSGVLPANNTYDANTTLYAGWARNCAATAPATCTMTVAENGAVTYTTACPDNTGYTLNNAGKYNPSCTAATSNVTFNKNASDAVAGNPQSVTATYGSAMPTPVTSPTRPGYTFMGYYDTPNATGGTQYYGGYEGNGSGNIQSAHVWDKVGNQTLYARWAAKCNKITFDGTTNGGTSLTGEFLYKLTDDSAWYTSNKCSGTTVTTLRGASITPPTKSYAMFTGFFENAGIPTGTKVVDDEMTMGALSTTWTVNGDTTLYAHYDCDEHWQGNGVDISGTCSHSLYNISYVTNGGTNYVGAPTQYEYGVGATINGTPTREHSGFIAWCTDSALTDCRLPQEISTTDYGDKTYYAQWKCLEGYSANNDGSACVANTITLNWNENGGSAVANGSCTYNGDLILPVAPSRTGYTFVEWVLYDGTAKSAGTTVDNGCVYEKTGVYEGTSTSIIARWSPNTYTIAYAGMTGATHGDNHPTSATYDEDVKVSAPSKPGYTFAGWNISGMDTTTHYHGTTSANTAFNTTTLNGTMSTKFRNLRASSGTVTFTAIWTANTNTAYKVYHYTKNLGAITYIQNGNVDNLTGTSDATLTLANLKRTITGFTYSEGFAGTAATGTTKPASGAVTTTTILADGTRVISLYYNRNSYNVSLTSGTGISAVTGGGTYEYGANVSINATVKNGYTWSKWQQTTGGAQVSTTKNYTFAMPASDLSYTAVATLNTYTITYDLDGGTHGTTHPTTYNVTSADIILSNPTKTGYTFGGWTVTVAPNGWGTGSSNSGSTNFKIATGTYGNIAFKAIWTTNAYVINYDMRGGTNYTNVPTSYIYGVGATINGTPSRANSTFTGWTGDNGDTPQTTVTISTTATGDKNYIANWSCLDGYHANNDGTACVGNTITLNYANGGHGTAPAAGSCTYGSTFDLPLLTAAGYTFDEWHVNNNAFDNGQTGVACNYANLGVYSGSVTITATWNTDVYTVTLSDGTGAAQNGAPSPIYLKYNDGWYSNQSATTTISALTTTPIKVGYLFEGYYTGENGTGTQIINNAGTIVANNTAITADTTVYAKYTAQTGFTVTTVDDMAAGTTFKFAISAAGRFYVDWGDGTVQPLNRTSTTTELVSHQYTTGGSKNITIYGRATGYSVNAVAAIRFGGSTTESEVTKDLVGGISGSLTSVFPTVTGVGSPIFEHTFGNCTRLSGNIPTNLFAGLSGEPRASQFAYLFDGDNGLTGQIPSGFFGDISGTVKKSTFERTFYGCSGLQGGTIYAIPGNLFDNISGSAQSAFAQTFGACSGLVGQIPANLFEHLTGTPQSRMFLGTFRDCVGLTGTVPEDLFGGISGAAESSAFNYTFGNCSGLTGYVPRGLFAGITSNTTGRVGVFSGSGLVTECPCGMKQYITGFEGADGKITTKVSCQFGTDDEFWHNGKCIKECDAGVTKLKTSNGLSVPLLKAKATTKNVAFKHNNKVCYSPVETGSLSGHVNLKQGATTYHISEPDGVEPDGFRNLPDGVLPAPGYTVE